MEPVSTEPTARGACLCGAVRFEVTLPTNWCAHCHCEWCRRAHGAPFVTWFGVAEDRFRLTAGEEVLRWRTSSPGTRRGFCGECGTPMLFASERWPGEVHVARATVDGQLDREPQVHVFWAEHVPWIEGMDSLPRFATLPGAEEPRPVGE